MSDIRNMKVLVVGGGGREHAVINKLLCSPRVREVICAPGNGGISMVARCFAVSATDIDGMVALAVAEKVDLAVVTPDDPLSLGMVDAMEAAGIPAFGPDKAAARIESSKTFAKELMRDCGINTAKFAVFTDGALAKEYVKKNGVPIVLKADGLAKGKGVIIANTQEEAFSAIDEILSGKLFGHAGDSLVIEEFLCGVEASAMCFCDGENALLMPSSQDHKRLLDGDMGKNTGGMGAFAPSPHFTPDIERLVKENIVLPTLRAMKNMGCPFKGVLYAGLMLTDRGPYVLEFNSRFGDPETQVVLPLIDGDLLEIMLACRNGTLCNVNMGAHPGAAATVVAVSGGYPDKYEVKKLISIDPSLSSSRIIHAGTELVDGQFYTNGGRVLSVMGFGEDVASACADAYSGIKAVSFDGMFYRKDIGKGV